MKHLLLFVCMSLGLFLFFNVGHAGFYEDKDFDGADLAALTGSYGSVPGNPDYNPFSDLNFDARVDDLDLGIFSSKFGRANLELLDFPVIFPDPNLESAIRWKISKPVGDIMFSDLQDLTDLKAERKEIVDLEGLQYCLNLNDLDFWGNRISAIQPLAGLVNSKFLDLGGNLIVDISPLANLLYLDYLWLDENQISDVNPLANRVSLSWLDLNDNNISNIKPLEKLVNLRFLGIGVNQISDIGHLAELVKLGILDLHMNAISDVRSLANLVNLSSLRLDDNLIEDIGPLVANSGIGIGDFIEVASNPLNSDSCNIYVPELQSRGAEVYHDCH